jgi:four helix bundle protein
MGRFIQIATGSGAELSYHLLLARDLNLLAIEDYSRLQTDLGTVMRMLSSLSRRVKTV